MTTTGTDFPALYQSERAHFAEREPTWLAHLREEAIERFRTNGLPTPRDESWKYTNLKGLAKLAFTPSRPTNCPVDTACAPSLLPSEAGARRLIFVDGRFRPDLSDLKALPDGVLLGSLADLLPRHEDFLAQHLNALAVTGDRPMQALNSALMADGFVLHLKPGAILRRPLEILQLNGAEAQRPVFHPRNLIVMESGSDATVIENHAGPEGSVYFSNGVTEISVGDAARLRHYKMQTESHAAFHLSATHVSVARGGHYDAFALSMGAELSRNEVSVRLLGEGAECHLDGAYLLRDSQHCDNTTLIEHCTPETTCHEVFKGVIDDQARAVFQGRIVVHRDAQKSKGHQLSKALLLSDQAEIDAKPELEIYADDVLCSHGATAGDLDHDALFYLRSRGIPEAQARSILIEAFLGETVGEIAAEGLCPALMTSIGHWLADARRGRLQ